MRGKRFFLFLMMIALGVGLGLLYGWVINPVKYEDTTPSMLSGDYKADYVLMVAEVYNQDQNLEQAARRLALLGGLPPARIVADANLIGRQLDYDVRDLALMDQLAQALQKAASTAPSPSAATLPPGGQP
jgi:hypothetical protein